MTMPDRPSIAVELLQLLSDGREHQAADYVDALAVRFALTLDEREREHPVSKQNVFYKSVMFVRLELSKARLVEVPRYGRIWITPRGRQALLQGISVIDRRYLEQFPEYRATIAR